MTEQSNPTIALQDKEHKSYQIETVTQKKKCEE